MSYKLGLLLSMVFLMSVLLLAGDLLNVAVIKNSLDALATVVSYRIAKEGQVSSDTRSLIESYGALFRLEDGERVAFRIGDTVTYYLQKEYQPFVLQKEMMNVTVRRSALIGYYTN